MAKSFNKTRIYISCFFVLCFIISWGNSLSQTVLENYPILPETTKLRKTLIEIENSQIGVRELTGNNDGKQVEEYLASVGLKKGNPYCAAGQAWCHEKANIPHPESGYSPDWFKANLVYLKYKPRSTPFQARIGQVVGFWVDSKKRIGHVGIIRNVFADHYETIEFNTNGWGSDEGQGVRILLRRKETVYAISDFAGYQEILQALKKYKK